MDRSAPVVVIGGGLSGLTAAAYLSQHAVPTLVINDRLQLGGRAQTCKRAGFHFNFGPHRLFGSGAAMTGLRALGISPATVARGPNGGLAIKRGRTFTMPLGHCSLLATGILKGTAKLELAAFLSGVPRIDAAALQHVSLDAWLRANIRQDQTRQFVFALIRAVTYVSDGERMSAAAGVQQLALALKGPVLYVHGGWATLVRALHEEVLARGAVINAGTPAVALEISRGRVDGVALASRESVRCSALIIATNPRHAGRLLGLSAPMLDDLVPIHVATLDIGLERLPERRSIFGFGVDVPTCFSVDSTVAHVAPDGAAVVHVAKFLREGEAGTAADERELEQLLDLVQTGWRRHVVERRFLNRIAVSHALVAAATGGFAGRPDGRVDGIANAFLAGDWVGPTGQLADASVASALRAARATERLVATS